MWLAYLYFLVTVITCVQAIFNNSLKVGGVALVAFALCYFGTAGFVSSFRARLQKNYKPTDLLGIGCYCRSALRCRSCACVLVGILDQFLRSWHRGPILGTPGNFDCNSHDEKRACLDVRTMASGDGL